MSGIGREQFNILGLRLLAHIFNDYTIIDIDRIDMSGQLSLYILFITIFFAQIIEMII